MPISRRGYSYVVVLNDSLVTIAEKHGMEPAIDHARRIWRDSNNSSLYLNANCYGSTVPRKIHLGNNRYRTYNHSNFTSEIDRDFEQPDQIIIYERELVWIPEDAPPETPPDTSPSAPPPRERKVLVYDENMIKNGIKYLPNTDYTIIYPTFIVKIMEKLADIQPGEKYVLRTITKKPTGKWMYKKTLTLVDNKSTDPNYAELRFQKAPIDQEYYLDVVSDSGTVTVVKSAPFCGAADEVPADYAGGVASGSSPIGDETRYKAVLKKAWTRMARGEVQLRKVVVTPVPEDETKVYFGVQLGLEQYTIVGRNTDFALPAVDWKSKIPGNLDSDNPNNNKIAEEIYVIESSSFLPHDAGNPGYQSKGLLKESASDSDRYLGDLLFKKNLYYLRTLKKFYKNPQTSTSPTPEAVVIDNDFLNKIIGICGKRDKTYKNESSGFFMIQDIEKNTGSPLPTENLALMIFVFIKMKIDDAEKLYELDEENQFKVVSDSDYTTRKLMNSSDEKYSIKAGIQQYYVYLEQDTSSPDRFTLKEIFCDGDQIQ